MDKQLRNSDQLCCYVCRKVLRIASVAKTNIANNVMLIALFGVGCEAPLVFSLFPGRVVGSIDSCIPLASGKHGFV